MDIWLPPGYDERFERYPIIYMHDGQNLFDQELAFGGVSWELDQAICKLVEAKKIPPVMVAGVWNSQNRWGEYMPQKPAENSRQIMDHFVEQTGFVPCSNSYLRFIVGELKPYLDSNFRTRAKPPETFLMGSSMGGLVSLYGLETYPQVFGGAACLSTHWLAGLKPLVDEMGKDLPSPGSHKLYFDFGTETLDAGYEPFQRRMDARLIDAGYKSDNDWLTLKFSGDAHNELSWKKRVHIPLEFLLS